MAAATEFPDASAWTLDPRLAYLNHGGFGATPRAVLAEQQAWRDVLERNPVGFLVHRLPELLDGVRTELATFLGGDRDGLVFVANATAGMQTIIAQASLRPGDEILATDHCYPAVLAQLRRTTAATGAAVCVAEVPLPADGRAAVTEAVVSRIGRRTRLVVLDHVASCSGLIFPVEDIVGECHRLGVPVAVDGAHAAGLLPVDLARLDADFWVGNLHKWVCAPKASAVIHAAPQWRETLRPLVASHGINDGYQPSFDWTGTQDPTAILAVPAALAFFDKPGWPAVRQRNNELAARGAELVARRIGTFSPDGPGLAAAMRLVRLPRPLTEAEARGLEQRLLADHGVVVPATFHGGWQWLRLSAQLYNTVDDYERLAGAVEQDPAIR